MLNLDLVVLAAETVDVGSGSGGCGGGRVCCEFVCIVLFISMEFTSNKKMKELKNKFGLCG